MRAVDLRRLYRRPTARGPGEVEALGGVSLEIPAGHTVAVVGRSGGGKSTLARCLALLERPNSGEIYLEGHPVSQLGRRELRRLRPLLQLVFQDPAAALDPRFTALEAVKEPLRVDGRRPSGSRALALMEEVGLPATLAGRSCLELSGGQKRRLLIARALAVEPQLLILDESFAGLDLSLQAQIVNLLADLQARRGLSLLLISHDLRLVAHLAGTIVVLDRGRIVESGSPREILSRPRHAVTQSLVAAAADGSREVPEQK